MSPRTPKRVPLSDLETHPEAYVTAGELARYWMVHRKQVYKQIEAGTLPALRLGPRLWRIRTTDALEFERRAHMRPSGAPIGRHGRDDHRHMAADRRKSMAKVVPEVVRKRANERRR
jgi:excisionase family DNA binding protein